MSLYSAAAEAAAEEVLRQELSKIYREAPGVESRKLHFDQAAKLAAQPVALPAIQVAPATGLEQAAFTQAVQTGVGAPALQGITAAASGVQLQT